MNRFTLAAIWMVFSAVPVAAQVSYLSESNIAAAQAVSQAPLSNSTGWKPTDVTQYWWPVCGGTSHVCGCVPPSALLAVIGILATAPYDTTYLTAPQIAALQTPSALGSAGWTGPCS